MDHTNTIQPNIYPNFPWMEINFGLCFSLGMTLKYSDKASVVGVWSYPFITITPTSTLAWCGSTC